MNAWIERLKTWWDSLATRERQIVGAGAAALTLLLLFLALWEPITKAHTKREQALAEARTLASRLEMAATLVEHARANGGHGMAGANLSLLAVVDQAAKNSPLGKPPSRLQPEGDTQVKVWLEDVPFDALVHWLYELQNRYGVRVDSADIERESGSGLVNARLALVRGS